jgi:hypothetical protein
MTPRDRCLEAAQKRFDALVDHGKRVLDVPAFPHSYVKGHTAFEFCVRVITDGPNRDTQYFFAYAWCPPERCQLDVPADEFAITQVDFLGVIDCGMMRSDLNSLVFVAIRQTLQHDEWVRQFMRRRNPVFTERLEVFQLVGIGVIEESGRPLSRIAPDGEFDRMRVCGFDSIAMTYRKLPSQVIERTAKIVDCVPDNKTPATVNLYRLLEIKDNGPLFTVEFGPKAVVYGMRPELFLDRPMKRVNVFFRSFELKLWAGQVE